MVTLAGLLCGVSSIYFSSRQAFTAAVVALLWALLCDWFDGPIARRMGGRTDVDREFGAQLDSLSDLVCSGVAPGMLLLAVSGFDPWFLPGSFLLAVAGALRLAHFETSDDDGAYTGLPIDSNIIVVTALYPFRDLVGHGVFPWVLYATVVALAFANVASFRTPKPSISGYYAVVAYAIGMTLFHMSDLLREFT
jgi:CDP-diacylglycerol--serine O-phosphatidyltransferase